MSLYTAIISSPLGDLYALADEEYLLILEFADSEELERKIAKLTEFPFVILTKEGSALIASQQIPRTSEGQKESKILQQTQTQLGEYFEGKRKYFDIPLRVDGTDFQKNAWKGLQAIPYAETRSYGQQANMIENPRAVRAIGGANHNNRIVIIIPCHRVIGASGKLVGYGGGIERKIWLLEHEKRSKTLS